MKEIKIKTEYIKLDQFLKFVGIAENGGHAKDIIITEEIFVNDELEKRRGRKIYSGYTIKVLNEIYSIK